MADNFAPNLMGSIPYRMLGEVDSPTSQGGLNNPSFGGSPEQLIGLLHDPTIRQHLGQFGVHFDETKMRQSPFLGNGFMQAHPRLGGALNQGMANLAATPGPQGPEGAGQGMSRAVQGMAGGPEMLRQFGVRQALAPFQAAGMQMPMMEMQRKQDLLGTIQHAVGRRDDQTEEMIENKRREDAQKYQLGTERIQATKPFVGPDGSVQTWHDQEPQAGTQYGQMQGLGAMQGLMSPQGPMPPSDAGWRPQGPANYQGIQQNTDAKRSSTQKDLDKAGAGLKNAQRDTEPSKRNRNNAEANKANRWEPGGANAKKKRYDDPANVQKDFQTRRVNTEKVIQRATEALSKGAIKQQEFDTIVNNAYKDQYAGDDEEDIARGTPGESRAHRQPQGGQKPQPQQGGMWNNLMGHVFGGGQGQKSQGPPPPAPQQQAGQQQPQGQLHQDDDGNLWDMSNPQQPVYKGKAN